MAGRVGGSKGEGRSPERLAFLGALNPARVVVRHPVSGASTMDGQAGCATRDGMLATGSGPQPNIRPPYAPFIAVRGR